MRSLEEFGRFYQRQLLPALKDLEAQRKALLRRSIAIVAVLVVCVVITAVAVFPAGLLALVLGGGAAAAVIASMVAPYRTIFKEAVIRRIVEFIDPSLT